MTNEEAVALLKQTQISLARGTGKVLLAEALRLAISALERRKKGQWTEITDRTMDCCYRCSECGFIKDAYYLDIANFCPNCGADMRKGEKECLETK